jgi:hypothetical protein
LRRVAPALIHALGAIRESSSDKRSKQARAARARGQPAAVAARPGRGSRSGSGAPKRATRARPA